METLGSILRKAQPPKRRASASHLMHLNYRLAPYKYTKWDKEYFPIARKQFDLEQTYYMRNRTAFALRRGGWRWWEDDAGYAI